MTEDEQGRLLVTQAVGSQVTAIDLATGRHEVVARPSMRVVGPDDIDEHRGRRVAGDLHNGCSFRTSTRAS